MSCYLTTHDGVHLALRDGFVLGRVAGCDHVVDDAKASRRHARICIAGGVAEIEDLGSSNGTRLNDKPVSRRMLRDGDRIQIGATTLLFREGDVPDASRAPAAKPSSAMVDDDDDLLGGAAPESPANRPLATAADDDDLFVDEAMQPPAPTSARAATPSPAAARTEPPPPPRVASPSVGANVVEFADEVVEVRKPAPATTGKASPAPGPAPSTAGRVLQFQNQAGAGPGGLLGDDLGQMGGGGKALLVLGALALGAGIVWLTIRLVR